MECIHKDNYFRTHQEVESNRKHAEYFEFELKEQSMTNIFVKQTDERFFKPEERNGPTQERRRRIQAHL